MLKMSESLIKEAFVIVVGKQSGEIIDFLESKKYVNEFIIAKKMNITINQARNILYRLSDNGLVSSTRKKDKRKGWYTYFWKIENLKSLDFLKDVLVKKIEQINNQIKSRETKNFYFCERCNVEFNEENALLYDFTCNECGGLFSMKDNSKVLNEFNREVDKLKKKLRLVEDQIASEKEILEKKKFKERVIEEKEKAKKKAEKKASRKLIKKIAKEKSPKKKPSKKAIKKKSKIKKKVVKSKKK